MSNRCYKPAIDSGLTWTAVVYNRPLSSERYAGRGDEVAVADFYTVRLESYYVPARAFSGRQAGGLARLHPTAKLCDAGDAGGGWINRKSYSARHPSGARTAGDTARPRLKSESAVA